MQTDPIQANKIDWSQVKTVMLDMDGTLLDLHYDNYFWTQHMPNAYAAKHNIERVEADQILQPMLRQHVGRLEWYCVNFWADSLQLDIMQLKREVAARIGYRPGAEAFLRYCNEHTDDVRLVTNAHRKVLDLKIERTNISQYFDTMLCSHELDAPKEQQVFWERLQGHQQFDPATTLFIDDSDAVLNAAEQYGVKHLHSIEQPDSQRKRDQQSRFPMIDRFENTI